MWSSVRASSLSIAMVLAAAPGAAQSDTVCFSFTAAITDTRSNLDIFGLPHLAVGDAITGTFAYDAASAGRLESGGTFYRQPDLELTLRIDGVLSSPDLTSEGFILVDDAPEGDSIDLGGRVLFADVVLFGLTLADATGAALSSEDLPRGLDLSSFAVAELGARSLPGDGHSFLFAASIVSLEPCAPQTQFVRADTNADGALNLSDAVATLTFLFSGGPEPSCLKSADSNDDGTVDIADGVFTLLRLFAGGQPIPPPHDDCGPDPTPDALTCTAFEGCG